MENEFRNRDINEISSSTSVNEKSKQNLKHNDSDKRTTLSLSLTVKDKKALKIIAMENETTIAAVIHEWIIEHNAKRSKNGSD